MDVSAFHPAVAHWFEGAFGEPTAAQTLGWEQISAGHHTLIEAPTGSGKTLAAFLWALNDLVCRPSTEPGVQVLYISPLKALNNDIQRNLETPLAGMQASAASLGSELPELTVGVRTGDTPPALRARQVKTPPHIFITTPESLYLLLTARKSQRMFQGLRYVILDEIHAIAGTKRGVHLALSLERLEEAAPAFVRIGLSATQRPLETVGRLLGGYDGGRERPVSIVRAQQEKRIEIDLTYPFASGPEDADFMQHCARIILEEAAKHRSTLVFCNARHVCERLSEVLNSAAGQQVAIAHHGSISRERRLEIEQALKNGELPLLIATSSLELGIDVGSVDMVIQVGSTKSVSRAMQRIGRAGHQVGAVSRGRVIAQHASDLMDAAAMVRGVQRRNIETTHVPRECLDVLAQHVVAMVAARAWHVDDILRVARRAQPFHDLSRPQLNNVLAMLAGRYGDVRFEDLKPRIDWDVESGEVQALPGALRLAVINGGTIPDRGYLAVELMPGAEGQPGKKLGELDEEFAAELYVGGRPAFSLGTSVWGVEAVERDRVLVRPAPGEPYQIPFWRNDRLGRGIDHGVTALTREIAARLRLPEADTLAWLQGECCTDEPTARALLDHVRRQEEATVEVPGDGALVVEFFRDEIGDGRVVIHSLFGMAVNGAWAFALKPRLREALGGIDPLITHNDDGIIMRLPPIETSALALAEQLLAEVRADNVEELLIGELADAPMLALRFREAAQRALLLPKPNPKHRTPLWLRRQRAADLLSIVRRKEGFPVLQEAVREVLHDTWDLNGLRRVLRGIESGEIAVTYRETHSPSPFASSLVWDFGLAFGEEGDAPRGECRAAYLALNRDLLRETLEAENLRQLLDPDIIAGVEAELAASMSVPLPPRWERLGEGTQTDLLQFLQKAMQYSGPASAGTIARRWQLPLAATKRHLNLLVDASQLSCGEFLPDGTELEYCAPLILARLHRDSLRRAREQIAPVDASRLAAFLPIWQGISRETSGRQALGALLHLPLTREQWQAVLAARFGADATTIVDAQTSRGALEWRAAGAGKLELVEAGAPARSQPTPHTGFGTEVILALLERHGALFAADVARRLARTEQQLTLAEVHVALEQLEAAGLASNDLFSRTGRWSAVEIEASSSKDALLEAYAEALLRRYGIVCREVVRAEKPPFSWAELQRRLELWEWRGRAIRGDFVRQLSAPQYSRREAVDLLRDVPADGRPILLAWEDPANAWGRILPLPAPRGKGRFVLLLNGQPLLTVGGWGRDLQPCEAWQDKHAPLAASGLRALAAMSPSGIAGLERWRGGSVLVSPLAAPLREAGFGRAGLRLVYRRPAATRLDIAV